MRGTSPSNTRADIGPLLAVSLAALLVAGLAAPAGGDVNHIVMRVNERIATLYDYERRKAELSREARAQPDSARSQQLLADLPGEVLSTLFQEMLLLSRAQQLNIRIQPEEIRAATEDAKASLGAPDDAAFLEAMRAAGYTPETFRDQMETNLLLQAVIGQEVRPRIRLEEEDLRRYYAKHPELFRIPESREVREVVVLDSSGLGKEAQLALAERIRQAAVEGQGLDEALEKVDAGDAVSSVIELGWIVAGDLDSSLDAAVWQLEPGAISVPIEARGGLHILEVTGHRDSSKRRFAEVAENIRVVEGSRRFQQEMRRYLKELEAKAYVRLNLPEEAEGFQFGDGGTYSRDSLDQFEDVFTNPARTQLPAATEDAGVDDEDVASQAGASTD